MRTLLALTALLIGVAITSAQTWTYKKGGDPFDGKYRAASVKGEGSKSPYNNPVFVVNYFDDDDDLNVYIRDAGYAGCDGKNVLIKFDGDDNTYKFRSVFTNNEKDLWFFRTPIVKDSSYDYNSSKFKIPDFLRKMKEHNKIYVRLKSNCLENDLVFPLSGSSRAINFVLPEDFWAENEETTESDENH